MTKLDNPKFINKDIFVGLREIRNQSVDMVFADPPYFLSTGKFTVSGGKRSLSKINKGPWDQKDNYHDKYMFHRRWITACLKKLKSNGTIWISGTYHSIYLCGQILQKLNWKVLNDICWFKPNGAPNLSNRRFTASHETLLWAINNNKEKHIYNFQIMKESVTDKIHNNLKQMRSVWAIPNTPKREKQSGYHPTQKPEELLRRVILSSTNENDIILDPFCGSGTTGVVAVQHVRNFIGIDHNQKYIDLATKRIKLILENKTSKKMVKGGIGGATTLTGLHFEHKTDFIKLIEKYPNYRVTDAKIGRDIYFKAEKVATCYRKNELYTFLQTQKIKWNSFISAKLLPDDAIHVIVKNTIFILEIKYQEVSGSTDEKLQTCDFKRKQYLKLFSQLNLEVEYIYIYIKRLIQATAVSWRAKLHHFRQLSVLF